MIKNKLFFLSLLLVLSRYNTLAQEPEIKSYVILTVEDSFSRGFEGVKRYYWIIETDSIKSLGSVFYPLLLSEFSKNNFENCCKGIDIDPFVLTPADSVFDIGSGYFKESEYLSKLIFSKRKRTQQIIKEWTLKKSKELITFYITPIKGKFCYSGFAKTGRWRTGYNGKIFIPYSTFEVNLDFWRSPQLPILSNIDFANFKFNIVR
ncbi:MAG: hypothetical protein JST21_18695 [Bacteroidetes bacterium]|nr:hypothetical protein [Bacteroidota bacterium]